MSKDNTPRPASEEFSFAVMIRGILNRVSPDIRAKQQSLTTDIDPSIPDTLIGDSRRLSQAILDLLASAGESTPEQGSIQLNARGVSVEDETLDLRIEVIDNGAGISESRREMLSGSVEKLIGCGISIESAEGRGSKCAFTVKTGLKPPEGKTGGAVSLGGRTALLAEDVEVNREIMSAMLGDTGLTIVCAENGREAVEIFSSDPEGIDVILMDINMPEMDGVEATRRIRASGTREGAEVPIIAVTANVLMSEVDTYFAVGMNDHVGKPVDFDMLLSKLDKYLNNS